MPEPLPVMLDHPKGARCAEAGALPWGWPDAHAHPMGPFLHFHSGFLDALFWTGHRVSDHKQPPARCSHWTLASHPGFTLDGQARGALLPSLNYKPSYLESQ